MNRAQLLNAALAVLHQHARDTGLYAVDVSVRVDGRVDLVEQAPNGGTRRTALCDLLPGGPLPLPGDVVADWTRGGS